MTVEELYTDAIGLLKQLIAIPSYSREEMNTAAVLNDFFDQRKIPVKRHLNNIWCVNTYFDSARPTILLNSHHDTVRPNPRYTRDPFNPVIEGEKLYGLGSNDAGGSLVSLVAAYRSFYDQPDLKYNLILAATSEEEISGPNGIECLLPLLPVIDAAIVGEPTQTNLAIAEKGLLVLDCTATGKPGHAAREEGVNAIYHAMQDIAWFSNFQFPEISGTLGPVKMSVTSINTENKAHNVIPAECSFVVDIRLTDMYTPEKVLEVIKQHIRSEAKPRSMRIRSSGIEREHPLVQAGISLGKRTYGSPTSSDAAFIKAPVLKCGPGDSARSHMADEYIYLEEIREGIKTYIGILEKIL